MSEVIELDPSQRKAVELVCDKQHRVGVITGGPGRGKTTCLRQALKRLHAANERVILCAPTGKAAMRLSEACGYPASTIHRLLGAGIEDAETPPGALDGDVVIVDEASMVDTVLAAALVGAMDLRTQRLLFVGDVDQLPSVGPGFVLGDLIACGHVPVVQLEHLHRAAAQSWVARNAPRVLAGDADALELEPTADFRYIRVEGGAADAARALEEALEDELNRVAEWTGAVDAQEAFEGLQVLVPMKKGPVGVQTLNERIQRLVQGDYMNERGFRAGGDAPTIYSGDKVLHTRNNYQIQVMNGETGTVAGIADKGASLFVKYAGREVQYSKADAWDLQLGYATTIHKSQGSEHPSVVVVCHSAHRRMLGRQLIYTAITRGKKRVVLVGDDRGLQLTLRNDRVAHRSTGLQQRIAREMSI